MKEKNPHPPNSSSSTCINHPSTRLNYNSFDFLANAITCTYKSITQPENGENGNIY